MLRLRSNCSVMLVLPCWLVELMLVRPAIVANCFSSGSATADAIVSGLAPGSAGADLDGREVDGRQVADTGSCRYAIAPNTRMPSMSSVVVTGRLMKSCGEVHGATFAASSALMLTRLPGTSRSWPSVTTVSPGFSPLLIDRLVAAACARPSTGRRFDRSCPA